MLRLAPDGVTGQSPDVQDPTKESGETLFKWLSFVAGVAGLLGAWAVIPYRVQQVEKSVDAIAAARAADRELLYRIDERLQSIQRVKQP